MDAYVHTYLIYIISVGKISRTTVKDIVFTWPRLSYFDND